MDKKLRGGYQICCPARVSSATPSSTFLIGDIIAGDITASNQQLLKPFCNFAAFDLGHAAIYFVIAARARKRAWSLMKVTGAGSVIIVM